MLWLNVYFVFLVMNNYLEMIVQTAVRKFDRERERWIEREKKREKPSRGVKSEPSLLNSPSAWLSSLHSPFDLKLHIFYTVVRDRRVRVRVWVCDGVALIRSGGGDPEGFAETRPTTKYLLVSLVETSDVQSFSIFDHFSGGLILSGADDFWPSSHDFMSLSLYGESAKKEHWKANWQQRRLKGVSIHNLIACGDFCWWSQIS